MRVLYIILIVAVCGGGGGGAGRGGSGRLATGDRDQYQVISSADLSPPALLHEWSLACVKYNPVYALISTQFICTILLLSSVDMDMKKVMLIRI